MSGISLKNYISEIRLCPDCDLLLPHNEVEVGQSLHCPRCGKELHRPKRNSINRVLALSIAGLLLYFPAIFLPLMTLRSHGFRDQANIIESITIFYQNDYFFVSFMVLLSAVIFPLVLLVLIFLVSGQLHRRHCSSTLAKFFRIYMHLSEWAMVEVYLLGVMISVIKMVDTTDVSFGIGLLCFSLLVCLTMAISSVIDRELFWNMLERPQQAEDGNPAEDLLPMIRNDAGDSGAAHGLIACHSCRKVLPAQMSSSPCPRCGQRLHTRRIAAISRTWALVLCAVIFLIPANVLPIMEVDFLGIPAKSTIIDGILYFFEEGSYLIGFIIFIASVLVPIFKVIGLIILLLSAGPSCCRLLRLKSRMYRLIVFIGRWSMLDIFVIALLSASVDFGFFTSIHAAPAATYFCLVVAATMLAAVTFDPRIMWDKCASDISSNVTCISKIRDNHET